MTQYETELIARIDSMMERPDVYYSEIHLAQLDLLDYQEDREATANPDNWED